MLILALFIVSIATVSASDVSDINDNQNIISDQGSISEDIVSENADLSSANSGSIDSDSESDNSNLESSEIESGSLTDDSEPEDTTTKNSTSIVSSSTNVVNGHDYSVTLKDINGEVLSGKQLIFTFNGTNFTRTTDSHGVASLKINLIPGTYVINVLFEGDELYDSSSSSTKITVSKAPTTISTYTKYAVKGESYSVVLKDGNH